MLHRDLGIGGAVRLSVRLSVTSRYHVKTNAHKITWFSPIQRVSQGLDTLGLRGTPSPLARTSNEAAAGKN